MPAYSYVPQDAKLSTAKMDNQKLDLSDEVFK